jgi:hypothetical protein
LIEDICSSFKEPDMGTRSVVLMHLLLDEDGKRKSVPKFSAASTA